MGRSIDIGQMRRAGISFHRPRPASALHASLSWEWCGFAMRKRRLRGMEYAWFSWYLWQCRFPSHLGVTPHISRILSAGVEKSKLHGGVWHVSSPYVSASSSHTHTHTSPRRRRLQKKQRQVKQMKEEEREAAAAAAAAYTILTSPISGPRHPMHAPWRLRSASRPENPVATSLNRSNWHPGRAPCSIVHVQRERKKKGQMIRLPQDSGRRTHS